MHKHASANRFYRLVWSHVHACWVAVAEGARGRGKGGRRKLASLMLGAAVAANAAAAPPLIDSALPAGAQVVAGQAAVSSNGAAMTVTQGSAQAILNWQSFDIGSKAEVRFDQPSASAVALNRVVGTDPSRIYGKLSANGQVFLLNQQGVLFGAGAQVNVGGLVASSLGLSDQDFLDRRYEFAATGTPGAVRNDGSIRTANGGYVALLAPTVANSGSIGAAGGSAVLAAGSQVGLDLRGDGLITVRVARSALDAVLTNNGLVQADGGQVVLSAAAADALARSSVNNTGLVQARGFAGDGGSIRLSGDTIHAGALDASSGAAAGGRIAIDGGAVALDGAINADGATGGTVKVDARANLSAAAATSAQGRGGNGGAIGYRAGAALVETSSASTNAGGAADGGSISVHGGAGVISSALHAARAGDGIGGRIDLSGADVRLLGATLDASGTSQGGMVRVGGAFQGGSERADAPDLARFTQRWGQRAPIASAQQTFINDSTSIKVAASGAQGQGGTAVVWSDRQTTMLGKVDATGAAAGGTVEISGKEDLRHVGLEHLDIGAGGQLLLDPKNITIGSYPLVWTYQAILGQGYSGGKNKDVASLASGDGFGFSVALNEAGDRLAVGAPFDKGIDGLGSAKGAVRLFSFSDNNFSNATLEGTIGAGYTGGKNLDLALADGAQFGTSLAMNHDASLLGAGAFGDGSNGSVRLFNFGSNFAAPTVKQTLTATDTGKPALGFGAAVGMNRDGTRIGIGALYDQGAQNDCANCGAVYVFDKGATTMALAGVFGQGAGVSLATDQQFGSAVAFDNSGSLMAVGAPGTGSGKGAVYLFSGVGAANALEGRIGAGVNGAKDLALTLRENDLFGSSVALSGDGKRLAIGATGDGGFGAVTGGPGSVRIVDFGGASFGAPAVSATLGRDYTVGANGDLNLGDGDNFGFAAALNRAGDRLVVGAPYANSANGSVPETGAVHAFALLPPPSSSNVPFTSVKPKPGLDVTIDAPTLLATLDAGVSITLQANNDIKLLAGNPLIISNATTGNGALTLQAGRSVTLDSSISTGNANLTVLANANASAGADPALRDSGNAAITTAAGTVIDAGSGSIGMTLGGTSIGAISVGGTVSGSTVKLVNQGLASSTVTVLGSGSVTGTGSGSALEIAAVNGTFSNQNGASGIGAPSGRYLVYSTSPVTTLEGVSGYDKHYNQAYVAGSTPAYAGSGNWFLYSVAPALNLSANAASRVYDGSAAVPTLTYGATGFIDNDSIASGFTGALSAAGAGKNVGTYAIGAGSLASALGYTLNYTGASYTVTPATLNVSASGVDKVYDRTTGATVNFSGNKIGSDAVNIGGTGVFADKNAGAGKTINLSGIALSGADAANYTLGTAPATTSATITPFALTASATGNNRVYDGGTAASATVSGNVIAGDSVAFASTGAAFADKNAGNAKTITVSGIGIGGPDAANYTLASNSATTSASITPRSLLVTASGGGKVYDGTAATSVALADNRIGSDDLALGGTASFADQSAGNGKTVTVGGLVLSGTDAGNYTLASPTATTSASITPRTLTVSATGVDKEYDRTSAATVSLADDRVPGDALTLARSAAFGDVNAGTGKTVSVSAIALSGNDAGNYTLAGTTATTSAAITPRLLTATLAGANKVYDGSTATTATLSDNRIAGDTLTVTGGAAAFLDKNAGTGKTVTASGITLGGASAGNYTLAATSAVGSADITPRALAATASATSKIYDGSVAVGVTFTDNRIAGDVFTVSGSGAFGDRNAGTGKAVAVTGIALSGLDAGNYSLASTSAAASADITPRGIAANATGISKVYDGSTGASVTMGDNRIAGDLVTLGYTGASFADKNAGNGKTISITGVSLSGTHAGNYTLDATSASATANITPRPLNISAAGVSKVYDGGVAAGVTLSDDHLAGDTLSVSGLATFADKNAGAGKTVTVTGFALTGLDAGNYAPASSSATGSGSITPRALAFSAVGVDKQYDGTSAATAGFTDNRVANDQLTFSGNALFDSKSVGSGKTVAVSGIALAGLDAGNYIIAGTTASTSAAITPRTLAPTVTGLNKTYDGTSAASVILAANQIAGEAVTLSSTGASFADKNAGTGKTISVGGLALAGADAGNYTLASASTTATADITPRALVFTATGVDRAYDGTLAAAITYSGNHLAGDNVSYTQNASFGDKHVGTGKTVTVSGIALAGADAGNYTLAATSATTSASITPRVLKPIVLGASKTYDGSTAATVTLDNDGIAGDLLALTSTGAAFTDKNAGVAKPLTVTGLSLSGAAAGDYMLASTSHTGSADIAPRALVTTATGVDKVYDGTLAATLKLSDNRLAGDVLVVNAGNAVFGDKNVGSAKAISAGGMTLSGADAGNYTLASNSASASASITPRTLNVSIGGAVKVYDGTTAAGSALGDDRIAGDALSLAGSAAFFVDKNAGANKAIVVDKLALSGADAGNYMLAATSTSGTGTITARPLNVTATAAGKVYDGTTLASATVAGDQLDGDGLTISSGTATFADKNAGKGKTVNVAGLTIGGLDAANYALAASTVTATADITPRALNVTAAGVDKAYDGTIAAQFTIGDNRIAGDTLAFNAPGARFADKNAGVAKVITLDGLSVGGVDAANYTLATLQPTATASITPRALTASLAGAISKVYDGGTGATLDAGAVTLGGFVAGEGAGVNATSGTFNSANVRDASSVSAVIGGASAMPGTLLSNYVLPASASGAGTITPRTVTVSGMTVAPKVYDGTTTATLSSAGSLSNLVAGEALTLAAPRSANYDNRSAGNGKLVTASGFTLADGAAGLASNYVLASGTASVNTGVITRAPLIIRADDKMRASGAANPAFTFSASGFTGGDGNGLLAGLTASTGADRQSPAGTYAITPAGGIFSDYLPQYVDGTLTVNGASSQVDAIIGSLAAAGQRQQNVFANAGFSPWTVAWTGPAPELAPQAGASGARGGEAGTSTVTLSGGTAVSMRRGGVRTAE
ncbi:filamentous hemagglutinin N-terminal domain-containing protein [Massilia violaceinigra]|uniref:Filamentous hemagglutinin N-terminal domain-containing protein n=1 Tax=Massilia violaceinigra TaxID=2045208 RepID=A0ABY4ADJ8_9BURK|nr:YDG domain-containing protein [Massilia violaceinigra]UOD32235.1 filamentous hemagglutinin N-terminal domain-containing protein [Massilia violaceinigra]